MKHSSITKSATVFLVMFLVLGLLTTTPSSASTATNTTNHPQEENSAAPGEKEFQQGRAFDHGIGVAQSYEKAFTLYKESAAQGNLKAMLNLGVLYLAGNGVTEDEKTGFSWVKKSAEGGDPRAAYSLSILLQTGKGVEKNPSQAQLWLQKSADANCSPALMALAQNSMLGSNGATKDIPHGLDLLKRAADSTNSAACMLLFKHYDEQFIKDAADRKIQLQDRADSLVWLGKAASYGDPAAQYEYAHQLMAAGKPSAAYPWAKLATDAHVPFANGIMNECIADIPPEQLTAGDKEAERIKAAYPKQNP
jgi:hypothetical protein